MGGSRRGCSWMDLLEGFPLEWDGQASHFDGRRNRAW
jgi:hypothetical protein